MLLGAERIIGKVVKIQYSPRYCKQIRGNNITEKLGRVTKVKLQVRKPA